MLGGGQFWWFMKKFVYFISALCLTLNSLSAVELSSKVNSYNGNSYDFTDMAFNADGTTKTFNEYYAAVSSGLGQDANYCDFYSAQFKILDIFNGKFVNGVFKKSR